MKIEVKHLGLAGMYGWNVRDADINLVIDEETNMYIEVIGNIYKKRYYQ